MTDSAQPPGPPATLLLVDDEASILSALRRLLRPLGYRILTAEGGQAGLELLAAEPVDLVISDMRMPVMDGAQFLEQVRARSPETIRILLTGYADISSTIAAINKGEIYRYIAKPWDDNDLQLIVRDALEHKRLAAENRRLLELTRQQNEELRVLNTGLEQKVAERTAEVREALAKLAGAHQELKKGFVNTVKVFSGLIELRAAGPLGGHSKRVAEHGRALAQRLKLKENEVQEVMLAGLLHDIGKIGLPDELLPKPFNQLSPEARAEVMRHPAKGQFILMAIEQLKGPATLVRHHHECFDGSGYPDRLAGLAIPMGARILAVVNDFDSLQLGTLVSRPLQPKEALTFLVENRGKRYDPQVVDAFAAFLAEQRQEEITELSLPIGGLRAGWCLSRDLLHPEGYLLLARDQVLTEVILDQLRRLDQAEGLHLSAYVRTASMNRARA